MEKEESTEKDYYKILGVEKDATFVEIKKAYRKMALSCFPDRVTPEQAEILKHAHEAYSVLSDPAKKLLYDNERED